MDGRNGTEYAFGKFPGFFTSQYRDVAGPYLAKIRTEFLQEILIDIGGLPYLGHDLGGDLFFSELFLERLIPAEH